MPPDIYQVPRFVKTLVRQLPGRPDLFRRPCSSYYTMDDAPLKGPTLYILDLTAISAHRSITVGWDRQ